MLNRRWLAGISAAAMALALAPAGAAGPARAYRQAGTQAQEPPDKPVLIRLPGIRQPFTEADVHFMSGMIPHHAQAVKMALLVPDRADHRQVKLLAERILVSQTDEIKLMQQWLTDRGREAPAADATHHRMKHGDVVHDMLMPGMLSDDEMKQLGAAKGRAFDRLFLSFMIKHHEGALTMVKDLFDSWGAAQDDDVYLFASDVQADQEFEIARMHDLLAEIGKIAD
jgi:uncharacterized protein (DUF305 family)